MFWKKKVNHKESVIDEELFEYIQPMGGITFKEPGYITAGDGYIKVLHLYQLPRIINDFWMDKLFDIDETIVTLDIHTKDITEVKKNINHAISDENSRQANATHYTEIYDAERRKAELKAMFDEISSFGETVKMLDFRIFVMAKSLVELEKRSERILKSLEGDSFMTATFLNEGKREWQSLFEPYTIQHGKPFCAKAHPMVTEQIAFGDPFRYSELIDPHASLLGFTNIGGVVLFDEFTAAVNREHYNSVVIGSMGSGKSTYLKKRFKAHAAAGNFLRTFDVSGEFSDLTREFGGKIISCDGRDGILNPLEILKAGDDDSVSYTYHITKVSTFFRCLNPSISDSTLLTLETYLGEFYRKLGIDPHAGKPITGRPAASYPIFSDFEQFLLSEIEQLKDAVPKSAVEEKLLTQQALELTEIHTVVKNITTNFGNLFNGHTSVDNITDEKIVTFDISKIKDLKNPFVAQMFNMLSLCWDNAVGNGKIMKDLWEKKQIDFRDVTKFLILIDESHRWVNTKMPMLLDILTKYCREARKYFAGITFASQSIRDFVPEGDDKGIDMIKTLFELTQYKFMFKQDSNAKSILERVFEDALTYSQIDQIPYLSKGETILCISGDRSLRFKVWLSTDYEEQLFAGGR